MGFSSIATEKREKEAENLRSFIIYSLIASAALHIGVLSLGIGNLLLARIPEIDSEPIEVAIVEAPLEEQVKLSPAKAKESSGGGGGGAGGGGRQASQLPSQPSMGLATNSLGTSSGGAIARQPISQPLAQTNPGIDISQATHVATSKPSASIASNLQAQPEAIATSKPSASIASNLQAQPEAIATSKPSASITPNLQAQPEAIATSKPSASIASNLQPQPEAIATPKPSASITPNLQAQPEAIATPKPSASITPNLQAQPEAIATSKPSASITPNLQAQPEAIATSKPSASITPNLQPALQTPSIPATSTAIAPPLDNDRLRKLLEQAQNNISRQGTVNQAREGSITGNGNLAANNPSSGTGNTTGNGIGSNTGNSSGTRGTGTGTGNGSGNGSGIGSGTGSGNGSGNGIGSNTGNSSGTRGTGTGTGNGSGNGSGIGSGTGSGNGSGIGSGIGSGTGSGNGSGIGSGTGSGNGSGTGNGTGASNGNASDKKPQEENKITAAPTPETPKPDNTDIKLNLADCQECKIYYPESVRHRRIEGNPEVAIDYDENGRVTNVRLTRSSGHRELDNALLEQARDFKLKPSVGGKQGIRVEGNYAMEGSRSQRRLRARQRKKEEQRLQREAQARQRENYVANTNQTPENSRKLPSTGIITDVTPEIRNHSTPEETPVENETPRQRRAESGEGEVESGNSQETPPSSQEEETTKKVRRLRDILRGTQPQPESLPVEPSQSTEAPGQSEAKPADSADTVTR
jgi:TonB family protein